MNLFQTGFVLPGIDPVLTINATSRLGSIPSWLQSRLQRFLKVMGMRDFFLMSVLNWQVPLSSTMFPGMCTFWDK